MNRLRTYAVALAALITIAAAVCQGKVFLRWGSARDRMPMDYLGGKEACSVPVEINGGRAELTVFSWDEDYGAVVSKLQKTHFAGKDAVFARGEGLSIGVIREGSAVTRIMAVNLPPRSLVFRVAQTSAEFEKSRSASDVRRLTGLPVYPGSTPSFYVANGESGAGFELSRAGADEGTVRAFYEAALRGDGWAPMTGAGANATVYGRGDDICMLFVGTSDSGTTIGLLHRKVAGSRD